MKMVILKFHEFQIPGIKPEKLVRILEHRYTRAGLSFQHLKNTDLAISQLLSRIPNYEIYMGQLTIHEAGTSTHL